MRLVCGISNKKIIWQNPRPSSPLYCSGIRIRFVKENDDITRQEISYIKSKISNLKETRIEGDKIKTVKHSLMLTMVDAKVCNSATNTTSTMKCYICGATSKDFNKLDRQREANPSTFKFGLSILHARIRFFESLLHLSYKLEVKKWQLRNEDDKNAVKQRKSMIQEDFRNRLGLIVDVPKAGFGNTNDGNTSRRFFADPEVAAEVTGLNVQLIYRLKVILETMVSGHKINTKKFATYALDTAKLYVEKYPWHPMTPTMHKILIHGAIVIENCLLPIGQLSEEAAEARNKHFRYYRLFHSRKFSRESCNIDVLNRLLLTSDPLLTEIRPTPRKTTKPFLKETVELLLPLEDPNIKVETEEGSFLNEAEDSSDEESWITSNSD